FLERFVVALLCRPYQLKLFTDGLLAYIGLDGTHSKLDADFSGCMAQCQSAIVPGKSFFCGRDVLRRNEEPLKRVVRVGLGTGRTRTKVSRKYLQVAYNQRLEGSGVRPS